MIVILDSTVLITLINDSGVEEVKRCVEWFYRQSARGIRFTCSEICDYEARRELIRRNSEASRLNLKNLEGFRAEIEFLEVEKETLLIASEYWALARGKGQQGADNKNIDADMIVAAHWRTTKRENPGRWVTIATDNIRHFKSIGVEANNWQDIRL